MFRPDTRRAQDICRQRPRSLSFGMGVKTTASDMMAIYQCLFFCTGVIQYWENLEYESDEAGLASLTAMISEGEWDAAELWNGERLIHRIGR